MANTKQVLTLTQLQEVVKEYLKTANIANTSFVETHDNIVGLLDKIGKIFTLETSFTDKLEELNGEDLPFGKTIEEWFQDLVAPFDYDRDEEGQKALKWYSPTYRPITYSYTIGRKVIPISIPNNDIERAVNNDAQLGNILTTETQRVEQTRGQLEYSLKRELLGRVADITINMVNDATAYTANSTALVDGQYYKSGTQVAVAMRNKDASADTFAQCLTNGDLVEIKIVKKVPIPVDTETGETFYKELKKAIEIASDTSEGYSWNGNTLGSNDLRLYMKQGVMPSLEVDTLSGAFHLDKVSPTLTAKVIKDFGSTTSNVYAILCDQRAFRLHRGYDATRENLNGYGDFLNLFRHVEYTPHFSRNAFITIFVDE